MKNAILLHGTGSTPDSFWFPAIRKVLEKNGYGVWAPQLPDADVPDIKTWLPFVLKGGAFHASTVLIGHSAGCPLILSVLENINIKIEKAVLVAGYARPKGDLDAEPILQNAYYWGKIKKNAKEIIFINSDNDQWGCDDKEGLYMWQNLGGTLILRSGEGHMGSDKFNQPYKEFPLLEKLVLL